MPETHQKPSGLSRLVAVLLLLGAPLVGCDNGKPAASSEAAAERRVRQQSRQGNALLRSIKSQLRSLADSVQLDLRPPTVVLDSRSSADGEDVMGVLTRRPEAPPEAPANQLFVPRRNAGFKSLGVKPGDTVKYFARLGKDTMDRLRETGDADIVTFDSVPLTVAQVLDDNTLIIVGGFPNELTDPYRLEIWRNDDQRMRQINGQLGRYVSRRDPAVGWEPSPDESELRQLGEKLNQWLRQSAGAGKKSGGDWSAPELMASLPEDLLGEERLKSYLSDDALSASLFADYETRLIQQAIWMRGVGESVGAEGEQPLEEAVTLFDWTVRRLQLIDPDGAPPRSPWRLLLHGKATAEGRAWVFAQLCRQRAIDTVVLSIPTGDTNHTLVGVVQEGEIYLFDPSLGLPSPGPEASTPATLAQLKVDDSLLRRMDLPGEPYPLTSELIGKSSLAIVAEPFSLSRRALVLQERLTGEDKLRLSVPADQLRETIQSLGGVGEATPVGLWQWPFETLLRELTVDPAARKRTVKEFLPYAWRPALWKGCVLHLRGRVQSADEKPRDVLSDGVNDFRAARTLFMSPTVRPNDQLLATLDSPEKIEIYRNAKIMATYWLGLISLDMGEHRTAKRWLENKALASDAAAGIADGVRYNLARAYEGLGEIDKAIELLKADQSPQRAGNLLRAKQLQEQPTATSDP